VVFLVLVRNIRQASATLFQTSCKMNMVPLMVTFFAIEQRRTNNFNHFGMD
jgi:hypothetical protein